MTPTPEVRILTYLLTVFVFWLASPLIHAVYQIATGDGEKLWWCRSCAWSMCRLWIGQKFMAYLEKKMSKEQFEWFKKSLEAGREQNSD
ncbi:MAG: hypothetical protein JWO13_797 [Acidobacteriales bacterium]|nr:hypothetical protein [Terriglobales bacterium]